MEMLTVGQQRFRRRRRQRPRSFEESRITGRSGPRWASTGRARKSEDDGMCLTPRWATDRASLLKMKIADKHLH